MDTSISYCKTCKSLRDLKEGECGKTVNFNDTFCTKCGERIQKDDLGIE